MKFLILVVVLLTTINLKGQSDTIFYSFQSDIITALNEYLDTQNNENQQLIYLRIQEGRKTIDLDLFVEPQPLSYNDKKVENLVKASNRFVKSDKLIPIVFYIDWIYAIGILYDGERRYTLSPGDLSISIDKFSGNIIGD